MKKSLLTAIVALISISFTAAGAQEIAPALSLMQLAKLTDTNGKAFGQFGTYAAISGNTAVINSSGQPSQFGVYMKGAAGWMDMTQTATLTGADGQVVFSYIAISGNTVVAAGYDNSLAKQGLYIFLMPAGGWAGTVTESAILGISGQVVINGNTIVVGSANLYNVFVKPSGGWKSTSTPKATLTVPLTMGVVSTSMAISGNTVAVGAPENFNGEGTIFVFVKPSAGWSGNLNPTATLIASNGRFADGLGWSVATNGNTIVAGAIGVNLDSGAAYVFVEPAGGWISATETAELTATNALDFGWSAGVSGNAIVIGAPFNTVGLNQIQGSAYVYLKPSSGWKSTSLPNAELTSSDGSANDEFGLVVSISGSTILATAPQATVNSNQFEGAAYVFGK